MLMVKNTVVTAVFILREQRDNAGCHWKSDDIAKNTGKKADGLQTF